VSVLSVLRVFCEYFARSPRSPCVSTAFGVQSDLTKKKKEKLRRQ
jgi:hypothetical protein